MLRVALFFALAITLANCGCGDNGKLNRCRGVMVEDDFPIDDTTEFDAQIFQTIVSLDHNTLSVKTPKGCYTFELTYCDCSADAGVAADEDMCSKISIKSPKMCQITKEGFKKRISYKALYDAAVKCDNTYKATNKGVYHCLTNCCKTWRSQMRKELGLPSSMFGACQGAVKALTIGQALKKAKGNNPQFGQEEDDDADDDAHDDKYYEYEKRAGGDPDGRDEYDPDAPESCPLPQRNGPAKKNAPSPKKKVAPSPKKKVAPSPKKKVAPSPKKKVAPSPKKKVAPSPKKKVAPSPKKKVAPSPKKKVAPSPKKKVAPSPKKKVAPSPKKRAS